jgi:hypothetical protein
MGEDRLRGEEVTGVWMQDPGCIPGVRVFQGPGSVFGARCPVLGVDSVPGIGSQVPGTRDAAGQSGNKAECLAHASKTRTRSMHGAG